MLSSPVDTADRLTLGTTRKRRLYTALIRTRETKGRVRTATNLLWRFELIPLSRHSKGGWSYRLVTRHRGLLDVDDRPLTHPNRNQQITLIAAYVNNDLVVQTDRHFGLLEIRNTDRVRAQWVQIKKWLLRNYPNANVLAAHFDWQLQDERIQDLYQTDPFHQFFFAGIFDRAFPLTTRKTLAHQLDAISLPVRQEITARGRDPVVVELSGTIDTEDPEVPTEKMNGFLGQLLGEGDTKAPFTFTCYGDYKVHRDTGLIAGGEFTCSAEIENVYRKMTNITLDLEDHG